LSSADAHRLRILEAALLVFEREGYELATLQQIAEAADLSVGVACGYFPTKEHFAIALYDRLANALVEWATSEAMPAAGTIATRFAATMRKKLALLVPHRRSLVLLAGRAIDPSSRAHVFGGDLEVVRSKVSGVFRLAVMGASDAPSSIDDAARLARMLYGVHLGMVLLALQDESPDAAQSHRAIAMIEGMLGMLVSLPMVGPIGMQVESVIGDVLLGTSRGVSKEETARVILERIFRHRRVLPDVPDAPTEAALALHLPRIASFMEKNEPIELVLPAFPAKAPNSKKVLGKLPDGAEWVALESLAQLLKEIQEAYAPGATLVICSDGHVFADAVNVSDEDIAAYRKSLEAMIAELGVPNIRIYGLEDAYALKSPSAAREHLFALYAMSVDDVRKRAAEEKIHAAQLDGIHRFMFEDEVANENSKLSRTQARKVTRERAYEVVRRSDAWGKLVDVQFPRSIRLSIHPQPDVSAKIGIPLIPTDDAWLTPWHGALVATPDGARLMRRADAEEQLGAVVVENPPHGRAFMEVSQKR